MMTGKPNGKPHNVFHVSHWQAVTALLILYDLVAVTVSYFFALFLRFDLRFSLIPDAYLATFLRFAPGYAAACVVVFMLQRLYRSIWRFASYVELLHLILANLITFVIQVAGTLVCFRRMPVSSYQCGSLSQFVLTVAIRFSYRFILLLRNRSRLRNSERKHVMVIGAGAAGQMIVRDIMKSEQSTSVACCIIDDNPNKQGRYVDGVPVVGGRDAILAACRKYEIDRICLAIPSASAENRRDILNICKESGCELKTLPGLYQLANGEVSVRTMKDVEIEDLLGREPVSMKMEGVDSFLRGKTVLVTGGGGSIGSELCRQIARYHPARLIVFEIYENSAYEIQQELKHDCPDLDLVTLIGSVRDSRRLAQIFAAYRPDVVYHRPRTSTSP
jgi:FlaA1/EpsC-like NDP-sugar epimerase